MKHLHFDVETDGFYGAYWRCAAPADHAVIAMLACARLGAPHTVVFGGFSAASLAARDLLAAYVDEETAVRGYVLAERERELALIDAKGWGRRPVKVTVDDRQALDPGLLLFAVFVVLGLANDAAAASAASAG